MIFGQDSSVERVGACASTDMHVKTLAIEGAA